MGSKERYKKRKIMREKLHNTITRRSFISESLKKELLHEKVDQVFIQNTFLAMDNYYKIEYDFFVSRDEAKVFLERFKCEFNQKIYDKLISDCKKEIIQSIVTPFGLGKIVAAYDKVGGNVDTVHNARKGIYATDEAKQAYNSRGEYDSHEYHSHTKYIEKNRELSTQRKEGGLDDYMTGEGLSTTESHDLDHVISAKEIHDDAGRVLAGKNGTDLANTDTNLKATHKTLNRSKKASEMSEFLKRKNENLKEMDILKSKENLSTSEQNRLKKLEELSKIDDNKAMQADKEARDEYNKEVNKYYRSKKFAENVVKTSATEGVKMGTQQALGLVIVEFFTAIFDEIKDIYTKGFSSGFDNKDFFVVLKKRIGRIAERIKEKWKDAAIAFKDGFLSGFISNLATTIINMFITTGKRVVRIIREGLFSLFRAVKLLLFPPKNMTFDDAMHEAKKLIATGLIISVGVLIEEYIDKMIRTTTVLEPFADTLTAVFVGAITGLAVTMIIYYIDKKKNDEKMLEALVNDTNEKFDKVELLFEELQLNY